MNSSSTVYTELAIKQKPCGRKSTFTTWGPLQLAGDERKECRAPDAKRNLESQISCVPTQWVTVKPAAIDNYKSNPWYTVNSLPKFFQKKHVALIWGIIPKHTLHTVVSKLAGQNRALSPPATLFLRNTLQRLRQSKAGPWFSYLRLNTQHAGRFAY